jgi:hypothetical protein
VDGAFVDVANHMTPVVNFWIFPSWDCGPLLGAATDLLDFIQGLGLFEHLEDVDSEEKDLLQGEDFADMVTHLVEIMFPVDPNLFTQPGELDRLEEYKAYTRSFWDAFLSPEYDYDPDDYEGLSFLNQPRDWHKNEYHRPEKDNFILEFGYSPSTSAFFVKDSAATPLVQLQDDGNVLLLGPEGNVHKDSKSNGVSTITQDSNIPEFLIKKDEEIVLKLDASLSGSARSDLYLKNNVVEDPDLTDTSSQEFIIWGYTDWQEVPQIIVDMDGFLRVRSHVVTHLGLYTP